MPPQEDRATATAANASYAQKHFVKIGPMVPEICSQTERQTGTHTHIHTDKLIAILCSPTWAKYTWSIVHHTIDTSGCSGLVVEW